jgi:hypothetical protein
MFLERVKELLSDLDVIADELEFSGVDGDSVTRIRETVERLRSELVGSNGEAQ